MTTTEPSPTAPVARHGPRARRAGRAAHLRGRERPRARAARRRLPDDARRVRRHHGPVGLRQVHPAQPRRRASTRPTRAPSCSPTRRSPARPRTSWPACDGKHIGIVFQFFNLLEGMTVLENVALPGDDRRARSASRPRPAGGTCSTCSACPTRPRPRPGSLSGGQRQRLAIARALANEPTLLLADEPTGALDSEGGHEVIELFRRLHQGGQTILMVTHDDDVAAAAERIARMKDGKVIDAGDEAASRCVDRVAPLPPRWPSSPTSCAPTCGGDGGPWPCWPCWSRSSSEPCSPRPPEPAEPGRPSTATSTRCARSTPW